MMIDTYTDGHEKTKIDYICVAGDLLGRMMSELQAVVAHNARLGLAMTTAGHDLRQRLQALLGTIELLTVAKPERVADLVRGAKAKIFRLANELEELALHTDDAGPQRPLKHVFNVAPVLEQVHQDWLSEAQAKSLGFKITHTVAMVKSDPYLLAVIVNNVVANAIRYTPCGEVCLDCTIRGEHLILEVRDTGPGIPDAVLERNCFANSGRPASEGLGLGLGIVKQTAELLGHPIAFVSGSERGTVVRLQVPLSLHES